jgi:Sigma 54 modulation protein / S30EA ribosomal protein
MDVLINTDNHVSLMPESRSFIVAEVDRALGRFSNRVTRAEVYLSDENAEKGGTNDKRCVIEVRPSSMQPVSASDKAATVEEATTSAAQKMRRLLDSTFGRVDRR